MSNLHQIMSNLQRRSNNKQTEKIRYYVLTDSYKNVLPFVIGFDKEEQAQRFAAENNGRIIKKIVFKAA